MRRLAATAAAGGGTIAMRRATDMRHKALPLPGQLALDLAGLPDDPAPAVAPAVSGPPEREAADAAG